MKKRILLACFLVACLLVGTIPCASAAEPEAAYDGYIVRLEGAILSENGALPDGMTEIYAPEGLYQVEDADQVEQLKETGQVAYAQPNYLVTLEDTELDAASYTSANWQLDLIGEDYAAENNITGMTSSGTRIRVGVIDSGLYESHESFQNLKILQGTNYCASESSTDRHDVTDTVGHGTFVTSIIAGSLVNGYGVQGVAPDVEIVPLKCFDQTSGSIALIIQAIYGAVDTYHCQVVNMSFGITTSRSNLTLLTEAIDYAAEKGVIMVAAVGNMSSGSTGSDPLQYPAAYENVIGVGSLGTTKEISTFSYENKSVFVTAPGENLFGAGTTSRSAYVIGSGTSFSTPVVTAAAALALSVEPNLTPDQFLSLLMDTAEDLGAEGYDTVYGYGMLRVDSLLKTMLEGWRVTGSGMGYTISICQQGISRSGTAQVVEAAYDEAGKLLSVSFLGSTQVKNGAVALENVSLNRPDGASKLQLFLLWSDTWSPVGESYTIEF